MPGRSGTGRRIRQLLAVSRLVCGHESLRNRVTPCSSEPFRGGGLGTDGRLQLEAIAQVILPQGSFRELAVAPLGQWGENFDIGADTGTPVSNNYQVPFRFTDKLAKLMLTINRPKLTSDDVKKLTAAQRNNRASE